MKKKKVHKIGIVSLGCPRNLVDAETFLARISRKGYSIVDIDKADIAFLNTCAFIEDAKKESLDVIMDTIELKKRGRLKKIIVCGCLAQRYKDALAEEFPEVDAFVGRVSLNHETGRFPLTPRHYAYVKICEGCVNHCSYCVIPKIKSSFESLDEEDVLKKIEALERKRVSEINIIGQDITGYGLDLYKEFSLPRLLKKILKKVDSNRWVRLLYLYPSRITDELLAIIKDEAAMCKYIDVPLQHINDRILKLMNRQTDKRQIYGLIDKIRKVLPEAALRTSIITGFPSETEREFKELLRFIEDVKFERLGAFMYSREEDTPAYNFKNQIPRKVKIERYNKIMSLQQKISCGNNEKLLGKVINVLIEEKRSDVYLGRSEYDAPEVDGLVYVSSRKKLRAGEFVRVRITDTYEYDCVGELLDEGDKETKINGVLNSRGGKLR